MIRKTVIKRSLRDPRLIQYDLEYWLSRPPEERVATVDYLRRLFHGSAARLQRTARIVKLSRG